MKIINVPEVRDCAVRKCAYNVDGSCHARAITIGDGIHPQCDTFLSAGAHCGSGTPTAGVGACKVSACRYNAEFECNAPDIEVGYHGEHPDCLTFAPGAKG